MSASHIFMEIFAFLKGRSTLRQPLSVGICERAGLPVHNILINHQSFFIENRENDPRYLVVDL